MDDPMNNVRTFLAEPSLAGLAAIATTIALVIALGGLWLTRQQMASDKRDAEAEHRQEVADRKRAQAKQVSAWINLLGTFKGMLTGLKSEITLNNSSGVPVYGVLAFMVLRQGAGPQTGEGIAQGDHGWAGVGDDMMPTPVDVLPPGAWVVERPVFSGAGMHHLPGVEIAFTDAAGYHWIRRVDGRLEEISEPPIEHYGIPQPVEWQEPKPAPPQR